MDGNFHGIIMKDPNSFGHVNTVYWNMGTHIVVKTTYRGKNSFGALVINWIKAKIDLNGNVISIIGQGS